MTKKQKPRLALLLTEWKPERYTDHSSTYKLSIVRIDPEDEKPRNCSRTCAWDAPGTEIFDGLSIECFMYWNHRPFDAKQFSTQYSGYMNLSASDVATLSKGMRKVQKVSNGFPVRPETFGQYACMIAAGMGVKECVRMRGAGSSWSYTDSAWQIMPLTFAQSIIDEEVARVKSVVCPEETESATVAA